MSDEEKKAIDELKEEINKPVEVPEDRFDTFILYNIESAKIVLNLIKKQSKEIEELKKYEEGYKLLSYGLDNYTSNDKIKAKIAELIKEGNYRTADNPNGRVHFQKEITDYQIEVLQSLLEKE